MTRSPWIWSVVTAVLGMIVLALTGSYLVAENLWVGTHGAEVAAAGDVVSSAPLYCLGLVGLILVAGGIVTALRARR